MIQKQVILTVEDDEYVRSMIVELLTLLGHDVLSAGDGADAVAILERRRAHQLPRISLALIDVLMPRVDGAKLVAELRARELLSPFIFMSLGECSERQARHLGAAGFLLKPFSVSELYDVVGSICQQAA